MLLVEVGEMSPTECVDGRDRRDGNLRNVLLVEVGESVTCGMCCW